MSGRLGNEPFQRLVEFIGIRQLHKEGIAQHLSKLGSACQNAPFGWSTRAINRELVIAQSEATVRLRARGHEPGAEVRGGMIREIPVGNFVIGQDLRLQAEAVERLPPAGDSSLHDEIVMIWD